MDTGESIDGLKDFGYIVLGTISDETIDKKFKYCQN